MNLRHFSVLKDGEEITWWFGGGYDLTPITDLKKMQSTGTVPHMMFVNLSAKIFIQILKKRVIVIFTCLIGKSSGIGGVFFDDYNELIWHSFVPTQSIGDSFLPAYIPIVEKRKHTPYSDSRNFQCYRRGRYVEFNLIYDRGIIWTSIQRTHRIILILCHPKLIGLTIINRFKFEEALLYQNFLMKSGSNKHYTKQ